MAVAAFVCTHCTKEKSVRNWMQKSEGFDQIIHHNHWHQSGFFSHTHHWLPFFFVAPREEKPPNDPINVNVQSVLHRIGISSVFRVAAENDEKKLANINQFVKFVDFFFRYVFQLQVRAFLSHVDFFRDVFFYSHVWEFCAEIKSLPSYDNNRNVLFAKSCVWETKILSHSNDKYKQERRTRIEYSLFFFWRKQRHPAI